MQKGTIHIILYFDGLRKKYTEFFRPLEKKYIARVVNTSKVGHHNGCPKTPTLNSNEKSRDELIINLCLELNLGVKKSPQNLLHFSMTL